MKKLVLLLVAALLVLAACGGGSSNQVKVDPIAYVKHAAAKTAGLKSEHMAVTGKVNVAGQSISLKGGGDFANNPSKGSFTSSISAMGQNLAMHEVLDGTTVYVSSSILASRLPSGKTWLKADLAQLGKAAGINYSSVMSQSPTQLFQQLEAAASVQSLGAETIDGVETTHYRLTKLDLSKLAQGAKIEALAHPKYGPIDVWVGNSDGYVYRESLSASFSAQGQSGSTTVSVDFSKFNEPVTVVVPAANETVDLSSLGG